MIAFYLLPLLLFKGEKIILLIQNLFRDKKNHLLTIPVDWKSEPYARVSYEVTMEASELHLTSGVEYNFQCVSGLGKDSGW